MSSVVLPYAPSETLGFIPERLERLTAIMARQVEEKKAPGVSMLIARHGRIAYRESVGSLRPGGPAMTDDAIFRIYSMTKPIVSVAAMIPSRNSSPLSRTRKSASSTATSSILRR
jgi:CubicO group peptidase (beta-lactamase class C family)